MEWVVIAVLVIVAGALLLRGPLREWRAHRRAQAHLQKRRWRQERRQMREQRSRDRAMNRDKAAQRNGPPSLAQVARTHGGKCWLCGTRTYEDDRERLRTGGVRRGATFPVIDYVVAPEQGGSTVLENARVAHRHCAAARAANPSLQAFGRPRRTYPATS